ncbi:cyclic nucleotide-binding domain-containing protein [Herbaspirillum sp. RTI4]|uniref:Crp/Fnr family transcriptional regulator n=1 Tax=Herbaspirillum sp. RTI4 TaxID=3048640 RepID=UPI002AB3D136|nr:cyclic nucleotide-binding domain-containing protein [Herbaspirillum sp. RTI4]MDY7577063.1 cyclic nucleotide-binding domain-containing protein [Herbaspirillum sp. RTI4]MEA9982243.1 cyclic nucleotide-binding domain-containing protein [Herbaspirillum sp. RTI4]
MKSNIDEIAALIHNAPIGKYIGESGAKILAERAAQKIDLDDDEVLCEKGISTNSFYIVTKGRLAITSDVKDKQTPAILHVLEKGDLVGELSFIDGSAHPDTVRSLGRSCVISFNKADIDPLINDNPELIFNFMRAIIKRVHSTLTAINRQQNELFSYIQTGGRGRL